MALVLFLFVLWFGAIFLLGLAKKRGWSPSFAWAHPSVLLPRLASPSVQLALLLGMYALLRAGHTLPTSALMACVLAVGVFGLASLVLRSAWAAASSLLHFLNLERTPDVELSESLPPVEESPESVAFRAKKIMERKRLESMAKFVEEDDRARQAARVPSFAKPSAAPSEDRARA